MNDNRRSFIKKTSVGAIGITMGMTAKSYAKILGANDRVNIGVVGIRQQGFSHLRNYAVLDNVEVKALCDVDSRLFAERIAWLKDNAGTKPKTYGDIRKLLEDKDIDAISVATPNHWHALAGIWAAQAGKHSTLEKPGTHNIFEGRQLINAAERYDVLIQHHAERRCFPGFKSAVKFLRDGGLGEVYLAKGLCYKWRDTIGTESNSSVPEGVDYDLWLGPAPERPFSPNRFHYNWHWHWDYGNGDMGNQGVHQMDIARWGLGVEHPVKISSMGGHFMFDDDQETANTQMSVFEFDNPEGGGDKKKMLQFEVRHWISNHEGGIGEGSSNTIGNLFYGSKGYMTVDLGGNWKTYMGKERQPGPTGEGTGNLFQNFVDSIRANDRSKLEGDIREGHYSCSLVHLANMSYRLGRTLNFDPTQEKCIGDDEANQMLKRDYRSPFVVPDLA